jgi:uncharacterized protein
MIFRRYPRIRAEHEGCWYPSVQVGEMVQEGRPVGVIKDHFGNLVSEYHSPAGGLVLHLATSLAMNVGDPLCGEGVV